MSGPSSTTPYSFISRGNLFITPVGPSIAEVPYPTQTLTRPREYSLWVNGKIDELPELHLDAARMPPSLYQEVRKDLVRYSPVEVTRSAFRKSNHAYVGVIDSKGTPYRFALDSRGMSVREVDVNDDQVWKTFDKLAKQEHMAAIRQRRVAATAEMKDVDHELSDPKLVLVLKSYASEMRRVGAELAAQCGESDLDPPRDDDSVDKAWTPHNQFNYRPKRSSWWRQLGSRKTRAAKQPRQPKERQAKPPKQTKPRMTSEERDKQHVERYEARARGRQAVRDKLRAERKQAKPTKPKASNAQLDAWRKKHPGGSVAAMADHPFAKALPKKSKEKPVKKTPNKTASKKKAGAGGKTRYTYPNEKKGGAKKPGLNKQVPLVLAVDHDDSKHADPAELANQLNVSVRTLQHTAKRLGRSAFTKFMRSHLKRFAAKHRLDPDYWGTLYTRLHDMEPPKTS